MLTHERKVVKNLFWTQNIRIFIMNNLGFLTSEHPVQKCRKSNSYAGSYRRIVVNELKFGIKLVLLTCSAIPIFNFLAQFVR